MLIGAGLLGILLWPLLPGLVLAAVLATLVYPVHARLEAHVHPPGLAAFVSTAGTVLLLLLPFTGVLFMVGIQAVAGIDALAGRAPQIGTAGQGVQGWMITAAARMGIDPAAIPELFTTQLQRLAEVLASRTLSFVTGIGGWLLQMGIALFSLYYLLRDTEQLRTLTYRLVPLERSRIDGLLTRMRDITHATVYGNVLVAAVQGLLGGLAFRAVGIPAATLWGTIMGVLSLIPVVGPPLVWVPGAIYLLLTGALVQGLILTALGVLVIGTIDNLLRSLFVGGRAHIHPLVVFLSVIGGVFLFGAAGLVAGPVGFVLALTVVETGRLAMGAAASSPPSQEPASG